MYEDYEFFFGDVARLSMSSWHVSEDTVKEAIREPDCTPIQDDSGIRIIKAQSRDFEVWAHYVVDENERTISVRDAGGDLVN